MNKQRILWFQDDVKLTTPINEWGRVDSLTQNLIALAGNRDFDHTVIDPISCAERLFRQIDMNGYSCIVDLSGFFGRLMKETFPKVSVVSNFHLSRIRTISSPRLDGSGFLVSLGSKEIINLKDTVDLSRPLFLDDVAWSGRTITEVIKILGVNPELLTVGLLIVNNGTFGEGKPGAFDILKEKGIQVLAGDIVSTPQDDGFHLADFFNFIPDENVFDDILKVWEKRAEMESLPSEIRRNRENEIKTLLIKNKDALFPKAISSEWMKLLQQEGRLYQYERNSQKPNV